LNYSSLVPERLNAQDRLRAFYDVIKEYADSPIGVNAYLPYSNSTVLMHIAGESLQRDLQRFKAVDQAQLSSVRGGIDLSQTAGSMVLKHPMGPAAAEPGLVGPSLKLFQGFDFQIIAYQPILNPAELFLGASGHASGPWFATAA